MLKDMEKMQKSKSVLVKIAKGIDPLTGEVMKEDSFLNEPGIIRCFYFMAEVLDNVMNGSYFKGDRLPNFVIAPEQKEMIRFPDGKIGVNEFSRQVNLCIDPTVSRKLTGMELNKRLKKMGILGEEVSPATGRMRTVTNTNSMNYGFEQEKRTFNGAEYDMVVMDDKGKQFLMDHLEEVMSMAV